MGEGVVVPMGRPVANRLPKGGHPPLHSAFVHLPSERHPDPHRGKGGGRANFAINRTSNNFALSHHIALLRIIA